VCTTLVPESVVLIEAVSWNLFSVLEVAGHHDCWGTGTSLTSAYPLHWQAVVSVHAHCLVVTRMS
jgi:hypothetical protein